MAVVIPYDIGPRLMSVGSSAQRPKWRERDGAVKWTREEDGVGHNSGVSGATVNRDTRPQGGVGVETVVQYGEKEGVARRYFLNLGNRGMRNRVRRAILNDSQNS